MNVAPLALNTLDRALAAALAMLLCACRVNAGRIGTRTFLGSLMVSGDEFWA